MFPQFTEETLQDRKDGYWIQNFHFDKTDKAPGLIVSGLNCNKVEYLENPLRISGSHPVDVEYGKEWVTVRRPASNDDTYKSRDLGSETWKSYTIAEIDTPVACVSIDVTGNGYSDVIVGYEFGNTMIDSNPNGGKLVWFENPGPDGLGSSWKEHFIGRWPTMHRLATGYFTQNIGALITTRFDGPSGLDTLIVASMEGVHWLRYEDGHWKREHITTGETPKIGQRINTFSPGAGDMWGTGSADAGKIGANPFAYVATIDPFHGPKVCVYTRNERGQVGELWKRHVLDIYGTPAQKRLWGDGPGHQQFVLMREGDGDDEFLVSLFGPLDRDEENKPTDGIICYKAIDLNKGVFAKWTIAKGSSARCTVGDFMARGRVDLASINYSVEHYYQEPTPKVTLHKNHADSSPATQIIGTLWSNEGMIYLPRPETVNTLAVKPLIEVANFAITVEVYPPNASIMASAEQGIKPLYGSIVTEGQERRMPLGGKPFPGKENLSDPTGKTKKNMKADEIKGAVILRLTPLQDPLSRGPWKKAKDVPVRDTFDCSERGLPSLHLEFTQVEKLWWGGDFKGVDFYNMTGFHFRFLEDKQNIAHMQFWTAGRDVDARLHDHSDNAFKELHTCLSQGTPNGPEDGMGGMWAPRPLVINSTSFEPKYPEGYVHCPLKPMEEHGRIWHEDNTGQAVFRKNNTVSYPKHAWHAGKAPEGYIDVWMALEFDACATKASKAIKTVLRSIAENTTVGELRFHFEKGSVKTDTVEEAPCLLAKLGNELGETDENLSALALLNAVLISNFVELDLLVVFIENLDFFRLRVNVKNPKFLDEIALVDAIDNDVKSLEAGIKISGNDLVVDIVGDVVNLLGSGVKVPLDNKSRDGGHKAENSSGDQLKLQIDGGRLQLKRMKLS
ncbi:Aldos-2-ulose dehydratase [Paramyrothecium foliicola]|nr:Aldos-2-ulose dehydratase [Paramyrothecium foliicola]